MEEDIDFTSLSLTDTSVPLHPPPVTATASQISYPVLYPSVTTFPFSFHTPSLNFPWCMPAPYYNLWTPQVIPPPAFQNMSPSLTSPSHYTSTFVPPLNIPSTSNLAYTYMQSLVRHLEWIIRLFTLVYLQIPSPWMLMALDSIDRSQIIRSPFWPPHLDHNASLLTVLRALVLEYNRFLDNFPH